MAVKRQVSYRGLSLIRDLEGLSQTPYQDSGGAWTIGVGHLLTRSELMSGKVRIQDHWLDYRDGLSRVQCWALLDQDLDVAEAAVDELVEQPLSQNEFDALVSFVFNVGRGAFAASTLLKRLNAGDYSAVPYQLRRWMFDNGRVVEGLKRRREREIELWLTPELGKES